MDLILLAHEEGDAGWPGAVMILGMFALIAFCFWVLLR